MSTDFVPGVRDSKELWKDFSKDELTIIDYLSSQHWYITRTQSIEIAKSRYKILLMKPSPFIQGAFNLNREVVVAFSQYDQFEPRSIDAIEYLDIQELRLEEICSILISKDSSVEQKVNAILKTNQEARVIIPFSYEEILNENSNQDYFINKLRKNFYSRDLFGIQDPLKKDLYFFGRRDLINKLINTHLSGENSGVFGLRKTGKTSIIYGVQRALERKKAASLFIDCQTLHLKSWKTSLLYVVTELSKKYPVKKASLKLPLNYDNDEFVTDYFQEDIKEIYRQNGKRSMLLVFDEIENITFETSLSSNWKSGEDFIKFWQVIRGSYQKFRNENIFTYLITGTNPRCVEKPTINKIDNPIFAQFSPIYIPAFDLSQTKEMIDKLGGYCGLLFEDVCCGKLIEDFGGHPLLMRQMCSFIHKTIDENRPAAINKTKYQKLKTKFYADEAGFSKYAQMVLEVLESWYPDEFQMLTWLSIGELETFNGLAESSPEYVSHLLNYGILEKSEGEYGFKIEALKLYLSGKNRFKRLNLNQEEKKSEISSRRNSIEPKLRKIVKSQLRAFEGEEAAKLKVIKELYGANRLNEFSSKDYSDFFNPELHNIYLKTLFELIRKNWESGFKNIFDQNVEIFNAKSTLINHYRKADAHATEINDADFTSFRGAMEWLEDKVENY